jgi:hypothetical protein
VPPEVEARVRARLAEFRAGLSAGKTIAAPPTRRARLTGRWKLGLSCAAAGLLVASVGFLLWPRTSLAELAAAVLQQPWIHLRVTSTGNGESDYWYSPDRNVVAARQADRTTYRDYRLKVADVYEAKDKVVYHTPLAPRQPGGADVGKVVEAVAALLQAERLPENPLARFDFLGAQRTTLRVLDQRVEKVTEAGHEWLDYRLTLADPSFEQPLRILIRADAATKLPALCRYEFREKGKPGTVEARLDYPERGPADLYDLGVPKTAQRIDRVPTGDLKLVAGTIKAGRERMDDYRAVFVVHRDLSGREWWTDMPIVVYHKGKNFRADYPGNGKYPKNAKRPDPSEDVGKWWHKRTEAFHPQPMYVVQGTTLFVTDEKRTVRPDGTLDVEIVSVSRLRKSGVSDTAIWSMCPEVACRPPTIELGDHRIEPVLEMHPPDGPPGCVRLSIRYTSTLGANKRKVVIPDGHRYWLDPKRDYIVVQTEMVQRDAKGQEKVIRREIAEETARSPQGVWYASRVRLSHPDADANQKPVDQIMEFHVDFDVKLPDSLFDPPKPGKLP